MKKEHTKITVINKKTTSFHRTHRTGGVTFDVTFLLLVLLLTGIGLVMLFSSSFPSSYYESGDATALFTKQLGFALAGIVIMFLAANVNYERWAGLSLVLVFFTGFLLLLVIIPGVGIMRNNARRWLGFGSISFQPSEVAKLALILFYGDNISHKKKEMQDFKAGIFPLLVPLASYCILLMLEPHLSGTILICMTAFVMLYVGGMSSKLTLGCVGLLGGAAFSYVKLVEKGIISYGANRILMWKDPWQDSLDTGYQMVQSLIAVGSGGLTGLGFGKSREKFLYLPEESNDFIFAVVCEELGFIGAVIILSIFMMLILRGFHIALHANSRFGTLIVIGIMTQLGLQVFFNVAVVTGLVPATGISLPFFSSGGTALLILLGEMGIVLNVSTHEKYDVQNESENNEGIDI